MKLEHRGSEEIPVGPDTVWAFVTNPHKVGQCLPDVLEVHVHDSTHFGAVVRVAVGPVRGRFKLKCELQFDPVARRMNIKVSGGGLGSAVDMTAGADIVGVGTTATVLNWSGEAEMRGPVATVGGRVLDAQAQKLIGLTFANVRQHLSITTI